MKPGVAGGWVNLKPKRHYSSWDCGSSFVTVNVMVCEMSLTDYGNVRSLPRSYHSATFSVCLVEGWVLSSGTCGEDLGE